MTGDVNLTVVRGRIAKAAATGAMSTAESVAFFDDVNRLLTEHAVKKLGDEKLSAEGAFTRLLERDGQFREIIQKVQSLQTALNSG